MSTNDTNNNENYPPNGENKENPLVLYTIDWDRLRKLKPELVEKNEPTALYTIDTEEWKQKHLDEVHIFEAMVAKSKKDVASYDENPTNVSAQPLREFDRRLEYGTQEYIEWRPQIELQKNEDQRCLLSNRLNDRPIETFGKPVSKIPQIRNSQNDAGATKQRKRPNPILIADAYAAAIPYRIMGGIAYIPKVLEPSSNFRVYVPMQKHDVQCEINFMYHQALIDYTSTKFVDEVYNALLLRVDRRAIEPDLEFMRHRIFFRNGSYELSSGGFSNVNFPNFFNSYLDVNYTTIPQATPCFDEFLRQISGGDVAWQTYLLEILGCCISNDYTSVKGLFVLQGRGNTGKTKILAFLQKLFPPVLRANLKFREFVERFGPGVLAGKVINVGDENTANVKNDAVTMLKAFTSAGGTEISVEQKYKDKINIQARCHLIFATNEYLRFDGATDAFLNRVFVIPFAYPFRVETGNLTMDDVLQIEKIGIIQKIISAYRNLMARKFEFSAHYRINTIVDSVTEALTLDCRKENLGFWISAKLTRNFGKYVGVNDVLYRYNQDAVEHNLANYVYPSVAQFAKDLRELNLEDAVFENRVVKKGCGHRAAIINYEFKEE